MKSFPFDSVVSFDGDGLPIYDRPYDASYLRTAFMGFFGNGVFYKDSDSFRVSAPGDDSMTVVVEPGQAHAQGVVCNEDTQRSLAIQAAHATYPRIDRVALRLNDNQSIRTMDLVVLKGAEATIPTPPEPARSGGMYDLILADVYITPNATRISASRITDKRLDPSVCGIVTANPQGISTENLYTQFQGALDDYLQFVEDAIDETLAGELQSQINTKLSLTGGDITGDLTVSGSLEVAGVDIMDRIVPVENGGTGGSTVSEAREGLGIYVSSVEPTAVDGNDGDIWFVYSEE